MKKQLINNLSNLKKGNFKTHLLPYCFIALLTLFITPAVQAQVIVLISPMEQMGWLQKKLHAL